MRILLKLVRIVAVLCWLPIPLVISLCVNKGKGYAPIRRVSHVTRLWARGLLKIQNLHIKVIGNAGAFQGGLIVSNHQGYFDILIHGGLFPIRFAAKKEIGSWPILGSYLKNSRLILVDRSSPAKSAELMKEFQRTMENHIPLLVYPEGTSTDGRHGLKPFKSTPFAAAASGENFTILPILTVYKTPPEVCQMAWYRNMTLLPHVWKVLGVWRVDVEVHILQRVHPLPGENRKELAARVYDLMQKEYIRLVPIDEKLEE